MGYMHINNLYKDKRVLEFRRLYAMEKIHGTSSHLRYSENGKYSALHYHGGGEPNDKFRAMFDHDSLMEKFRALGHEEVTVYGESYGGKQQKQSWRYGPVTKFIAFEVQIDDIWLSVPNACDVASKLGLEFVHWEETPSDLDALNALRDAPSVQAVRNGVEGPQPMEGIVLRPPFEVVLPSGERLIAKHKRDEERETATPRAVGVDLKVEEDAKKAALDWVTHTRLLHVLDAMVQDGRGKLDETGRVAVGYNELVGAMKEDVLREGKDELVVSRSLNKAIGHDTVRLYKRYLLLSRGRSP